MAYGFNGSTRMGDVEYDPQPVDPQQVDPDEDGEGGFDPAPTGFLVTINRGVINHVEETVHAAGFKITESGAAIFFDAYRKVVLALSGTEWKRIVPVE